MWTPGLDSASWVTTRTIAVCSVAGLLRNLARAGVLKKRSRTSTAVPTGPSAGPASPTTPPSPTIRKPRAAAAGRDSSDSRETAKIAGSASPRNPRVPIAVRSASVRSFEVACRSRARRQSSGVIPRPSSVTEIS